MSEPLYRVRVLLNDQKSLDVGPAVIKQAAQELRDAIEGQIRLGREKTWKEPIIYPIYR